MDTPKQQCSWLEDFPPDIWAYFAWYLPGEQLGRLMMTGATRLWQRLKFSGVVKSIKLGEDFLVFKSFPRFLNDFYSLDELIIHSNNDEWAGKSGLRIDSIPSGVRKLKLSGDWNGPADTLFGEDGATLKLNEHLPHLEVLDLYRVNSPGESWICHSPQSLTTLKLPGWRGTVELPTSLIHFEANGVTLSTSSFVSKLPPSLETFATSALYGIELIVPLLPPSLHKLSFGYHITYSDGPRSQQSLLEQLPKYLTCLKVPKEDIKFFPNPESIAFLPSTLTELKTSTLLPCSAWHLLPPRLTKLSLNIERSVCTVASKTLDSHGVHHEVRSIPFDFLPKSITSLSLCCKDMMIFCGPPTLSNRSYFPPQLTYLDLDNIQLSPETTKLLPSSLTLLRIENLSEQVCEHLPSSLEILVSPTALITPNLIKFLPKSLTTLQLHITHFYETWFDYNTGQPIDSGSNLAEYSIYKSCSSHSFDWKNHPSLPSTLTKLNIPNANEMGDTFLQYQQLPNLIELDLGFSEHFTDLSIPLLPPHLTRLDLGGSSQISGKCFQFLPRCLTWLYLATSESIFDSDVQHLPRTLRYVVLRMAIHLTDLCIPDLPPQLEWLDMRFNSQISTSSLPKLPYSIRSSKIRESALFSKWGVYFGKIVYL